MTVPLAPLNIHVRCPLCGETADDDLLPSLLRASVIEAAWAHCYDRHPQASGVVWFHVESEVAETHRKVGIGARQLGHLELIQLPVPSEVQRRIRRQRKRRAELAERDSAFLRALLESDRPSHSIQIGRKIGIDGRLAWWCAHRLLKAELVERMPDGRLQPRGTRL